MKRYYLSEIILRNVIMKYGFSEKKQLKVEIV